MATYTDLRALIDGEPANATATDADVLVWVNADVPGPFLDVAWLDVNMWLVDQGIDRATLTTAATSGSAANKTAAQYILDVVAAGQPLAATDSRVRDTIAASSLNDTQKQALLALARPAVPRYATIGWPGTVMQPDLDAIRAADPIWRT